LIDDGFQQSQSLTRSVTHSATTAASFTLPGNSTSQVVETRVMCDSG
jgi:hypothetical protein